MFDPKKLIDEAKLQIEIETPKFIREHGLPVNEKTRALVTSAMVTGAQILGSISADAVLTLLSHDNNEKSGSTTRAV